jgi:hypothetical protein
MCNLLRHFSSLLGVCSRFLPLVFSGLLIMWWPEISEDEAVCRQRLKQVGEILQECLPDAKKFEQLVIMMEKYEVDDWQKVAHRWEAKQAALGPEERWARPGQAKFNGLPGLPVVGNFAAPGTPSSATQTALLSSGVSALVAPPQRASVILNSANVAIVEANKQQALAKAAFAQAAI